MIEEVERTFLTRFLSSQEFDTLHEIFFVGLASRCVLLFKEAYAYAFGGSIDARAFGGDATRHRWLGAV
ncbi:MAG: hypothetical protein VXV85_07800, partial [Candidatus Thermoplasmatota archaeon]|nr:hypothetical protein [Candidatus Thermoplasmatota archaeon]